MKQLVTLVLAVVFANISIARTAKAPTTLNKHHAYIAAMLQKQEKTANKWKAPVHMEILKAQSTRDNVKDSLTDSVRVLFAIIDTAMYDYNTMIYPYNYPYSTSPMFNNDMGIFTTPRVWFSNYYHWAVDPNTLEYGFFQEENRQFNYNKNLVMDTMLYTDSATIPNMIYSNTYNASNNITAGYCFVYSAGKADSLYKQYYSYIGGMLKEDSIYQLVGSTWHLVSKTYYTYNVANDLIQIDNYANPIDSTYTKPLVEWFKYTNTFDGSHRMLSSYAEQNDGKVLAPYVTDTFAYTGTHTFHTSWKEYQYDEINTYWAPISYMTKHLNLGGLPDTVNIQGYDSLSAKWVPNIMQEVKYDSVNNPDTLFEFDYNFTSFPAKPNYTTVYYYNYILNPNAVNTIAVNNGIRVYPVPAHESVSISGLDKGKIQLTISDMQGRVCAKQHISTQNGNMTLPVDYLASGSYILTLQNANGELLGRKLIVKE